MDPDATLERLNDALMMNDEREARDACADLYCWLQSGGFEPQWVAHPTATDYYVALEAENH